MESFQRAVFIDMVVDRFTFKYNRITLFLRFNLIPKTDAGLPKTGATLYCEAD